MDLMMLLRWVPPLPNPSSTPRAVRKNPSSDFVPVNVLINFIHSLKKGQVIIIIHK